MKVHELKIEWHHLKDLRMGLKPYEVRKNDRDYEVGDYLLLRPWEHDEYIGGDEMFRIKHILSDFVGLGKGYVVLALNEVIDRSIT